MFLTLLLKGFIIGIAFIIPGVSGGTLAIYLGIYDKLLHSIGHVFKEFKKSVSFLLPVFLGIAISIVALAKVLGFFIEKNSFVTLCFFIGLIIGGIPHLFKEVHHKPVNISSIISFVVAFALVLLLMIFKLQNDQAGMSVFEMNAVNILVLVLLGMVASTTMIIPGISGSALLMVLGFYTAIVTNVVGNILDFSNLSYHLYVIIPFGIGAAIGIVVFSKAIEFSLRRFKSQTYYAIIGFIMASIIVIFCEIRDPGSAMVFEDQVPIFTNFFNFVGTHIVSVLLGVVSLVTGLFISKLLVSFEGKSIKDAK
ncbi:MAG: DUF368 domain-containing protein [Firmicutes bacterium]|nr:DUF368 domain-containing protein [Bacillota bacterium]